VKGIETRLARLEARIRPAWNWIPTIKYINQVSDGSYVEPATCRTFGEAELEALGADYLVIFVPPRSEA
jgi:hypothetical protein